MLTQHIREFLQVTPGPFPDFWVGPGDEATHPPFVSVPKPPFPFLTIYFSVFPSSLLFFICPLSFPTSSPFLQLVSPPSVFFDFFLLVIRSSSFRFTAASNSTQSEKVSIYSRPSRLNPQRNEMKQKHFDSSQSYDIARELLMSDEVAYVWTYHTSLENGMINMLWSWICNEVFYFLRHLLRSLLLVITSKRLIGLVRHLAIYTRNLIDAKRQHTQN